MRVIDADILSYALLENHIATPYARPILVRALKGELEAYVLDTTLLEAYHTLYWYYRVRPRSAVLEKLRIVAEGLNILCASPRGLLLALEEGVPPGDGLLVATALQNRIPIVVSDDKHVKRLAGKYGLIYENPIPEDVKEKMGKANSLP
ncbi:type II toxin-antitoxin system VapC family toxin [Infirmifilum lucidum]|uniref:Type II toxin-antitoxin system VapC family toxin n=1 Tax=Infirmifilum lucidum TaxID=2776706 RepID=A0A7L9FKB9_9CREN|nr:type II toxin-antitoxin system VapC family toxin [Infirmifilum lucidum]QOJ79255.1 type II toxin-antitoxin system VapC family toxin [Infirmifilum lucidum]